MERQTYCSRRKRSLLTGFSIHGKLGLTIGVKRLPLIEVTSSFHLRGEERAQEQVQGFWDNYYRSLFLVNTFALKDYKPDELRFLKRKKYCQAG